MKLITKEAIARLKKEADTRKKLDYSMNTKYYRVVDNPERVLREIGKDTKGKKIWEPNPLYKTCTNVFASVDPLVTFKVMIGYPTADLWEIKL